jgi:hypothetical protein
MKEFNWSFNELYCLPVSLRRWIIEQSVKMTETKGNIE